MMNSVNVQIQRAINDAISNQVLPQIQSAIMAGSGHVTRKGWNVPAERPEINSEVLRKVGARGNSRSEHVQDRQDDDQPIHNAHDNTPVVTKIVLPQNFYKSLRRRQIVPVGPRN